MNGRVNKVCFLSNSSGNSGGAERSLPKLLYSLREQGITVYVLLPSNGPMVDELKKLNIDYCILPYRMWMHRRASLLKRLMINIFNLIMLVPISIKIIQWNCDIIISSTITIPVGALASRLTFRKHIWYIKEFGLEDHGLTFDLGEKISYLLIKLFSDFYIFNSLSVQEKYIKLLPIHKCRVIYEGYISKEQEKEIKKSSVIKPLNNIHCLMIGTIQEGKGHEDAIKSLGELKKEDFNLFLDIVGRGFNPDYEKYLRLLITQYQLENNIFFHGHIDDPFPIIKESDIFLMCSRKEAFGIVTTEAMQFGKPIIGTRSGGTQELIVEGFNGLLYTPGNYLELAIKIKYLLKNPEISRKMGENGKKLAYEKFTLDRYITQMTSILESVMNK